MNSVHLSVVILVAIFARSLARYTSFVHFLPEYDPFSPFSEWTYPQDDPNAYYAVISREPSTPGKTGPMWFIQAPVATSYHPPQHPYTAFTQPQYYSLNTEVANARSPYFIEQSQVPRTLRTVSQHDGPRYRSLGRAASHHDDAGYPFIGRTASQHDDAGYNSYEPNASHHDDTGYPSFGRTASLQDDARYRSFGQPVAQYDDAGYAPFEPKGEDEEIPESTLYYPEMLRARLYKQLQAIRKAYRLRKALGKMKNS
ncbi:hypothetical protein Aduo_013214 [Ancylostoma duodenale]